MRLKQHW